MIKRLALLLVLGAAFAATPAARSQQPTVKAPAATPKSQVSDSVNLQLSPELQQSLEDLAASLQALANRIASDPKLRADAIHVASGLVATAQQVVNEQSAVLQEALKTAADKIAAAPPPTITPRKNPR